MSVYLNPPVVLSQNFSGPSLINFDLIRNTASFVHAVYDQEVTSFPTIQAKAIENGYEMLRNTTINGTQPLRRSLPQIEVRGPFQGDFRERLVSPVREVVGSRISEGLLAVARSLDPVYESIHLFLDGCAFDLVRLNDRGFLDRDAVGEFSQSILRRTPSDIMLSRVIEQRDEQLQEIIAWRSWARRQRAFEEGAGAIANGLYNAFIVSPLQAAIEVYTQHVLDERTVVRQTVLARRMLELVMGAHAMVEDSQNR